MSDKYETDVWIRTLFPYSHWFDPCPINWTENTDKCGLSLDWRCRVFPNNRAQHYLGVFVNPPYSNILSWVKKAISENERGVVVVMLLKHDSSTEWYRLLHEAGARFLMINKRLKHRTGQSAAFPSVLAVLE